MAGYEDKNLEAFSLLFKSRTNFWLRGQPFRQSANY